MTQCQKQAFPFQCRMSLACTGGKFPRHSVEVPFGLALWAAIMVGVHALCFSPDTAVLESPKSNRVVTSGQGHHTRRTKLLSCRSSLINCPTVLHSRAFLHGAVRILHTSICVDYFCQGTVEKDQEERCSLFTEQQLQEPLGHHREL